MNELVRCAPRIACTADHITICIYAHFDRSDHTAINLIVVFYGPSEYD